MDYRDCHPVFNPPPKVARNHTDHPAAPTVGDVAPVPTLAAVWCCSVGSTWTLELRKLDRDSALGTVTGWISSGVPVSQPAPDALARELLAAHGLRLFRDSSAGPGTRSRHPIGYVCANTEPLDCSIPTPS
jgi:hypothetical protein